MTRTELPSGAVTGIAYSEKENVLVRLLDNSNAQPELFLLRPPSGSPKAVRATLPHGFVYSEITSVPGTALVLCLVKGPSEKSREPLISRSTYLWMLDLLTEEISPVKIDDEHTVMTLIGPSEYPGEVICVTLTSHRTDMHVLVEYHISRISIDTGIVTILNKSVGPRWI